MFCYFKLLFISVLVSIYKVTSNQCVSADSFGCFVFAHALDVFCIPAVSKCIV